MNSYCSLAYLCVFLPLVVIAYAVMPQRHRWKVLLAASYVFFWYFSQKLLIFIVASTLSIHHTGLWLEDIAAACKNETAALPREERKAVRARYDRQKRRVLAAAVVLNLGILLALKYTPFAAQNVNALLTRLHIPLSLTVPRWAMPLGLSFYTLQAVSYLFDVYRGKITADRNLFRLALYMSFFPALMEGPICRYEQTADSLFQGTRVTYHNLTFGVQRILFGLMKKIVVADRLNLLIKTVFNDYSSYDGGVIALAMVCYTCQLYMEFSGTMDIVLGSGEIFGVKLPENFRQPFFSRTISDFWSRWHITLGTWFRDYLFYPLSMSKPLKKLTGKARRRLGNHYGPLVSGSIALFAVWFCNGLWHGAAWNYLFFGLYHFALILTGNLLEPLFQWAAQKWHIRRDGPVYRGLQIARTVILVNIGELFFRANGLRAGLSMFGRMVSGFTLASLRDGSVWQLGMDRQDFLIVLAAAAIVLVIGLLRERGISIRESLAKRPLYVRWPAYLSLILFTVVFGAYGAGYIPIDPIYANF